MATRDFTRDEHQRPGMAAGVESTPTPGWTGAIVTGVLAGWMLLAAQLILSGAFYGDVLLPWRSAASVLIGRGAFDTPILPVVLVGAVSHFGFSIVFAVLFGVLVHRFLTRRGDPGLARLAGYGTAFGFLLWLVNLQLVARLLYPWLLELPQAPQMALHALLFGLPLGMMRSSLDRRLQTVHRGEALP